MSAQGRGRGASDERTAPSAAASCSSATRPAARPATSAPNFTDEKYHNLGVGMDKPTKPDLGRYEITKDEKDHGAFKTPTSATSP